VLPFFSFIVLCFLHLLASFSFSPLSQSIQIFSLSIFVFKTNHFQLFFLLLTTWFSAILSFLLIELLFAASK
jgi:hypothetical protein